MDTVARVGVARPKPLVQRDKFDPVVRFDLRPRSDFRHPDFLSARIDFYRAAVSMHNLFGGSATISAAHEVLGES